MMGIPYTRTTTALSLVIGFRPTVIPNSHPNFDRLVELVAQPDTTEAQVTPLLDIPKAIETFTGGNVTVVDGRLFYKGFEVKSTLATVILNFVKAGQAEAAKPFELFMDKAFQNPDPRAVSGLYDWVVAGKLPITPDGDILAWKAVQGDYFSIRAGKRGKLRHMIGDVVEEPRHECNSDPNQTCSSGIHFCSVEYLKSGGYASGGSRIMAVTISPTDVVAFPGDYNLSKGRCCRLTVVGEVPQEDVPTYYSGHKSPVYSGWQAKPAEAAAEIDVKVGEVWRSADGYNVTITSVDVDGSKYGRIARGDGHPRRNAWFHNGKDNGIKVRGQQLVSRVSAAPEPAPVAAAADPAPAPAARAGRPAGSRRSTAKTFPLVAGQIAVRRDGREVKVISVYGGIARLRFTDTNGNGGVVFADTGAANRREARPNDVIRIASDKPVGFAVGQKWQRRDGSVVTLKSTTESGPYPLKDDKGNRYTRNGRYNSDTTTSGFDLTVRR